ncbi:TIGR04452 family lipoprotein [Leptospira semungkisensis]|uniref:TIGR04452 family lipoprotein n=1 Tax=Leptospira semungkisensis TaxID=2484985 RepID=A0A4R9G5F0_9LEPT|nr:TIGR04452 family lipoprotein [Leptospira semungkisensis]TGK06762.1 TIGR04452 family lipoprotein [Leptospira semungkisensis]
MKKTIYMLGFLTALALGNCAVLDPIGISSNRVKGSAARKQIKDAVTQTDTSILSFSGAPSSVAAQVALLDSTIAASLAKVDDGKYYKKDDVDGCVKEINTVGFLFLGALNTVVLDSKCDLKADGIVI